MKLVLILALFAAPLLAQSNGVAGRWQTPTGAVVEVAPCGDDICARILTLDPHPPTRTDTIATPTQPSAAALSVASASAAASTSPIPPTPSAAASTTPNPAKPITAPSPPKATPSTSAAMSESPFSAAPKPGPASAPKKSYLLASRYTYPLKIFKTNDLGLDFGGVLRARC